MDLFYQVNFDECGAIVTEPYFNFTSIREAITEVLFEDYQFQFLLLCNRKFRFLLSYRPVGRGSLRCLSCDFQARKCRKICLWQRFSLDFTGADNSTLQRVQILD